MGQEDIYQEMAEKFNMALDPNDPYTMEDYENEFMIQFPTQNNAQGQFSNKFQIDFVNMSNNMDPKYETKGSSGFDLRANLLAPTIIGVGKRAIIPTGLFFQLPDNFEIQIRPRSGLAAKHGITVLNTPGTIDADYRGEIKIILINLGEEDFEVKHGERIAQAVISTVTADNIIQLNSVISINEDTDRGTGGFGSTGTK